MTDDMPFFNIVLDANPIDLLREVAQKIRIIGPAGRFPHSRKVYRKALEAAAQTLDDAFPETTAGGHAVDEKDRNSGTATYKMHQSTPIELMKLHTPGRQIAIARRTSRTSSLLLEEWQERG